MTTWSCRSSPGSTASASAKDVVRQFVAMPLGSGYSVEEQITGKAEHGGLQILVYPMKKERYEPIRRAREEERSRSAGAVRMYCSMEPHMDEFRHPRPAPLRRGPWRSPPAGV